MSKILYIVVPCYNEEAVLPEFSRQALEKMQALIQAEKISQQSKILFVNDGSTDSTRELIEKLHSENKLFSVLNLSRNRGHQNALLAGLMVARERCDISISMDADLQDDIGAIDEMIEKHYEGCDIVYGVRSTRKKDSLLKRRSAQRFYKTMNKLGAETVYNHADFRLMSRRALEALSEFEEKNLFLRGMVPMIGFKTDVVYYERNKRYAGKSKFSLRHMLKFAIDGVTSFSSKPLKYITLVGFLIFFASLAMITTFIIQWATGRTVVGWASVVCSIWGIGGLIMLSLGIIGEYIGKIYIEAKHRPSYFIESLLDSNDNDSTNE